MNPDANEDINAETLRRLLGGPAEGMVLEEPVGRIAARGHSRRRRRRALSAAAGAAGVAGVVALALVLPTAPANGPARSALSAAKTAPASKVTSLNVDLAAFSLKTDPSSPYIAITLKQLGDETLLEQYLKEVGIDADLQEVSLTDDQALDCVSTAGPNANPLGGILGPGSGNIGYTTFESPKSFVSADPHLQIFVGRRPSGAIYVVAERAGLTCAAAPGSRRRYTSPNLRMQPRRTGRRRG